MKVKELRTEIADMDDDLEIILLDLNGDGRAFNLHDAVEGYVDDPTVDYPTETSSEGVRVCIMNFEE
jgi:hypothetical protein